MLTSLNHINTKNISPNEPNKNDLVKKYQPFILRSHNSSHITMLLNVLF